MDRLSAPEQNAIGAYFANLLRKVEQDSGPEFLPRGLDVMGLVRQLALPSAETVEKLSYGDPLFRMPTQSNIPITTDRGYVAEVLGMAPAVPAASRATTRISNEMADQLVRAITGNPQATAPRVLEETSMPFMQAIAPKIVKPGDQVSGLTVREEVPNMSSIPATLDDYEVLSGIREVPRNAFDKEYLDSLSFEKLDERTKNLANQINESKEINPMIVAVDSKGAYIIEGGHRFDALMAQDTKSIPAMVVIDKSDPPTEDVLKGLLEPEAAYRGSHTAPNATRYGATLDSLEGIMPADVYSSRGKSLYGLGNPKVDAEWFAAAYKAKGNPDAEVTIYRAVPKGVKDINSGDWVTTSKTYADMHGENTIGDEYEILSRKVKAKTLSSEGYPYEFGYNE
jgi:disulfide oxidoreductase YuzD